METSGVPVYMSGGHLPHLALARFHALRVHPLPKAWGLLLSTTDFKGAHGHLPDDRWRDVAFDAIQEAFSSVPIPTEPGGEGPAGTGGMIATPVRYHLRGSLYGETPSGEPMGPMASVLMAVQLSGSIARFEDGRLLRFMVPYSGASREIPQRRTSSGWPSSSPPPYSPLRPS